jgi:hypothetical protein
MWPPSSFETRPPGAPQDEDGFGYPCGCGATSPVGGGAERGLPAGGTAEERGVVGSITDSRTGRLPSIRSLI